MMFSLFLDVTRHRFVVTDVSVQPIESRVKHSKEGCIFFDYLTLEDGTNSLSRNVGYELQISALCRRQKTFLNRFIA
jgi:hypothetical protein